jgi:hypothetical protein
LSPVVKTVKGAMIPATDLRLNMMYLMNQAGAQSNPETAAIWDKTANFQVYDGTSGKAQGQDATALLKAMDLDPHGLAFSVLSPIAGLTDFYTKWLGADPVGAVGSVVGEARTAQGLKGTLGRWFSGLGITDAEDAYRAREQYPRVMRAFQVQADMRSSAEIMDRFPGTYTATQATALARLRTLDEVTEWHGMTAEVGELMKPVAPTMSAYELIKMYMHNEAGEKLGIAGEMTPQAYRLANQLLTPEQLKQVGIDPAKSAVEAAGDDLETRARVSFGRWLGTRLDRSPMYYDEIARKMENRDINWNSSNAIPAIMDLYRLALFPEKLVKVLGQALTDAAPFERSQIYEKGMIFAATSRVFPGIARGATEELYPIVVKGVQEQVAMRAGVDGGGEVGQMIAGAGGDARSKTYDPENLDRGARVSAVREGQLGIGHFVNMKELRGLGLAVRKIVETIDDVEVEKSVLRHAAIEDIQKLAEWVGPALEDAKSGIYDLVDHPDTTLWNNSRDALQGYRSGLGEALERIGEQEGKQGLSAVHAYTAAFDAVRTQYMKLAQLREIVAERAMLRNTFGRGTDEFKNGMAALDARIPDGLGLSRLEDITPKIERRLQGQVEAFNNVSSIFENHLFGDDGTYARILKTEDDYQKHVLENPRANYLNEKFLAELDKAAKSNPRFLNPWQKTVDWINKEISMWFVPAALFSGAWSFHISVSEGTLNTARNGFGATYDAKLITAIGKHQTGETYLGKFATGWEDRLATTLRDSNRIIANTQDHAIAAIVTKAMAFVLGTGIRFTHDVVSGALMGIDRVMLAGMDDAARERMLNDFVTEVVMQDGALDKIRINHVSSLVSGSQNTAHMKDQVYGLDKNGAPEVGMAYRTPEWSQIGVTEPGYANALSHVLHGIKNDEVEGPVARAMRKEVYDAGAEGLDADRLAEMEPKDILERGAQKFSKQDEIAEMEKRLKVVAYDAIKNMDPVKRARYARDKEVSAPEFTEKDEEGNPYHDPHRDWAGAAVWDVMHAVKGEQVKSLGETTHYVHPSLLEQVGNPKVAVKDARSLNEDLEAIGKDRAPQDIPVQKYTMDRKLAFSGMEKPSWLNRVSDLGHAYVFGPIANSLVRDPLFLLMYHQEMETIRALGDGVMDDVAAQTLAETRAFTKMIRLVHNPMDKTVLEQNARVVSPFYFAQNQALRRAGRVLREDPGAFEKYLKLSLGVTNWVSTETKNGQEPLIHMPGTQALGWIASKVPLDPFTRTFETGLAHELGFSIAGSPGSVSSMVPTGAIGGVNGILGNLVRPSWDPIVAITGEVAEFLLNSNHWINDLITQILGPENVDTGIKQQVDASSVGRAATDLIMSEVDPHADSSSMSTMLLAMNNMGDNYYKSHFEQSMKETLKLYGLRDTAANQARVMKSTQAMNILDGLTSKAFSSWMNDPHHMQQFINQAQASTASLQLGKLVATMFSPLSPSIQETFSKDPQFQQILATKKADGEPLYGGADGYQRAFQVFAMKYPSHILDVVSRSTDFYGPWPETKATLDFVTKYPELTRRYSYAAAYLQTPIDGTNPYNAPTYTALVNLGLRGQDTSQDFIDAMLVKAGQQYYNGYLKVKYGSSETGLTQLKQAAITYGIASNPVWLSYHTGTLYTYQEDQALTQMGEMVNDKAVSNSIFGSKQIRDNFGELVKYTNQAIAEYNTKTTSSERDQFAYNWYGEMQNYAQELAKNPSDAIYVPFITDVMQGILDRSNL